MINFGQSCIAAKRFIIESSVYDAFVALFLHELKKLKPGSPLDEDASYACMARPDLAAELYQQVRETVALGARVLAGGKAPEPGSARFEPTVLENIPKGSPAYSEELFGPVASLFKVASAAEAELGAGFQNAQKAIHFRTTLAELGYPQGPTTLLLDNTVAIGLACDTVNAKRSKSMDMRFFWLRDHVRQGHL
jgi:hypothetical protein